MNKADIQNLAHNIKQANNILLINHIRMDPDAFGSLAGLYLILEKIDKKVTATNDSLPPKSFSFLGYNEIFKTNLDFNIQSFDLIISLDAGGLSQLGETYKNNEVYFKKATFAVIDHHKTNPGFGDINIIDSSYASTCEMIYDIAKELDWGKYIGKEEATLLTAGIHTDTNIFYNTNTSSRTLRIAADLMDLGADFRSPMFHFFKKQEFHKIQLCGRIYSKLTSLYNGKVIYTTITKQDFSETYSSLDDTSGIINFLSNIDGCEIVFLIYETESGIKASFRSEAYDVGSLAASFEGGGGHKSAAGFSADYSLEEATTKILEKLEKDFK